MSRTHAQQQGQQRGAQLRNGSYQALPNVLLGNIPVSTTTDPKQHVATFQPGPMGVRANWKTGEVLEVPAGGQAENQGVRAGMVIVQIDGQKYSENLLDKCKSGQRPYTLGFNFQDCKPRPQHNLRVPESAVDGRSTTGQQSSPASGQGPFIVATDSDYQDHSCFAPGSGMKLLACVGLDLCGNASYLLPEIGEGADLVWAPMQAIALRAMFHSNTLPMVALAEELLPGTDIIPTATIAWCLEAAGYLPPPETVAVGSQDALRPTHPSRH